MSLGHQARAILQRAGVVFSYLDKLDEAEQVEVLNLLRADLHQRGPFAGEPVDLVVWVEAERVQANDYNPNSVAPPEMALLEHSIVEDGYTQPIVAWGQKRDSRSSTGSTVTAWVVKQKPCARGCMGFCRWP